MMAVIAAPSSLYAPGFSALTVRRRPAAARPAVSRRVVAVASPTRETTGLQYKKLGDSDLVISNVTLGTMTWGGQNTEAEAHEQLNYAFDHGINILDTAEGYPIPMTLEKKGQTELFIGNWLKSRPRDKVIVATKVSGYSERLSYLRKSGKPVRVDEENILEGVENSLQRLGIDYIDLLQIHWPDRYVPMFGEKIYDPLKWRESVPIVEQLQALKKVIDQGKVRYVGVSNETSWGVMEFCHAAKQLGLPKIVSIQNSYSLMNRTSFEVDLLEVCLPQNCNIGLLAYSPLAGGSLSGKYMDGDSATLKAARLCLFPGFMDRYNKSLAREAVSAYVDVARRHNLTPVELALGYVRGCSHVTSSIIGATTMEQLKENISAFTRSELLSEDVLTDIEKVFVRYKDPAFR
ncbi:hypothetical protein CY35_13G055900 [Sphagnum magellanicum]|nr:hypothetical protein CY35_13G055900 [Sphagnum magellanicum]